MVPWVGWVVIAKVRGRVVLEFGLDPKSWIGVDPIVVAVTSACCARGRTGTGVVVAPTFTVIFMVLKFDGSSSVVPDAARLTWSRTPTSRVIGPVKPAV